MTTFTAHKGTEFLSANKMVPTVGFIDLVGVMFQISHYVFMSTKYTPEATQPVLHSFLCFLV